MELTIREDGFLSKRIMRLDDSGVVCKTGSISMEEFSFGYKEIDHIFLRRDQFSVQVGQDVFTIRVNVRHQKFQQLLTILSQHLGRQMQY